MLILLALFPEELLSKNMLRGDGCSVRWVSVPSFGTLMLIESRFFLEDRYFPTTYFAS
jgi:hypothetical protein